MKNSKILQKIAISCVMFGLFISSGFARGFVHRIEKDEQGQKHVYFKLVAKEKHPGAYKLVTEDRKVTTDVRWVTFRELEGKINGLYAQGIRETDQDISITTEDGQDVLLSKKYVNKLLEKYDRAVQKFQDDPEKASKYFMKKLGAKVKTEVNKKVKKAKKDYKKEKKARKSELKKMCPCKGKCCKNSKKCRCDECLENNCSYCCKTCPLNRENKKMRKYPRKKTVLVGEYEEAQ